MLSQQYGGPLFLHVFVAEKSQLRSQMLCEVSSEKGATRAARVAAECLRCVDPAELAKVRGGTAGTPPRRRASPVDPRYTASPFGATGRHRASRSPSPSLARWGTPQNGDPELTARRSARDPSPLRWGSRDNSPAPPSERGRSAAAGAASRRRRRSSSLRRGEHPGDLTNVRVGERRGTRSGRTGLLDIEMPHRCGLKAFVVIDCSLVFAAVAQPRASREGALPLLRAMRREFLSSHSAEDLADLHPHRVGRFGDTLDDLLHDANRPPGQPAAREHYGVPALPRHPGERQSWAVRLNVYNILDESTNARLSFFGMGLHHTGVEVHDREWSYGGVLPGSDRGKGDETGLFCIPPRTGMPQTNFKQCVDLGRTHKNPDEVDYIIGLFMSSGEWRALDYHILNRNCNHFCAELVARIGGWEFPNWINRAAEVSSSVLPEGVVNRILRQMQPPPAQQPQLTAAGSGPPPPPREDRAGGGGAARRAQRRGSLGSDVRGDTCGSVPEAYADPYGARSGRTPRDAVGLSPRHQSRYGDHEDSYRDDSFRDDSYQYYDQ